MWSLGVCLLWDCEESIMWHLDDITFPPYSGIPSLKCFLALHLELMPHRWIRSLASRSLKAYTRDWQAKHGNAVWWMFSQKREGAVTLTQKSRSGEATQSREPRVIYTQRHTHTCQSTKCFSKYSVETPVRALCQETWKRQLEARNVKGWAPTVIRSKPVWLFALNEVFLVEISSFKCCS